MWKDYDTGDHLLFTKPDFETPSKSKLLLELWNSGDSESQSWLRQILVAAKNPLSETPLLEDGVRDGKLSTLTEDERRRMEREFSSASSSAVVVDETDSVAFAIGWADDHGLDVDDADVAAVIDAHLDYLRAIGAVGPPAAAE